MGSLFRSVSQDAFSFFAHAHGCTRSRLVQIALIFLAALTLFPRPTIALDDKLSQALKNIADPKFDVCLPAIQSLGKSHNGDVVEPLIAAFQTEKRSAVKVYLVDALGMLRSPVGVPALKTALSDPSAQVRQSAVIALEEVGGDEAEQALMAQTQQEKDFGVKANLIAVLDRSANPKAANSLQFLAHDKNSEIRDKATQSLKSKTPETVGVSKNTQLNVPGENAEK